MSRTITAEGGPLHGKRYTVPHSIETFTHGDGTYRLTEHTAVWEPGSTAHAGLARVAAHAREGHTVLLVGHTLRAAAEAFNEVAAQCSDADTISHATGAQRIHYANGGRVITTSEKSRSWRGISADVLYLLPEVRAPHELLQSTLATSPIALTLHHEGA